MDATILEFARLRVKQEDVRGKDILEVGSADVNGSVRPLLEGHNPRSYFGVDVAPGDGVDEICRVEELERRFGPDCFDLVVATELVEHVLDWRAAITGLKRVLKPGGIILLTTRSAGFPYHGYPADYWRYELQDIEAIFTDFEIEVLERDPLLPGVLFLGRKRAAAVEAKLGRIELFSVLFQSRVASVRRRDEVRFKLEFLLPRRLFRTAWHGTTRILARLPRRLKSSRQLAREAIRIGAVQKAGELSPLLKLVRSRAPEVVVEIGTARGGTLWAFSQVASPNAMLASIDLPAYLPATDAELEALKRTEQDLLLLRRDSHEEQTRDDLVRLLEGRRVDLLFIDGDHSYEGVKRDFELYAPLVRPGGLVAFHDVLPHATVAISEVDRFWGEVKSHYRHEEFLEPDRDAGFGRWGGIGVLYWNPDVEDAPSSGAGDRREPGRDDALALRSGADHRHG